MSTKGAAIHLVWMMTSFIIVGGIIIGILKLGTHYVNENEFKEYFSQFKSESDCVEFTYSDPLVWITGDGYVTRVPPICAKIYEEKLRRDKIAADQAAEAARIDAEKRINNFKSGKPAEQPIFIIPR